MQTYVVDLKSDPVINFRTQKAADALDIDIEKKLKHHLEVKADVTTPFNIGLIVGASGSGKTTLAREIWGEESLRSRLDKSKPVINQLPENMPYNDCAKALSGIGLTSVPCWIRPAGTLSNGQQARAEAVLAMIENDEVSVIDEWTSVVDRTVAKVMSHSIQKYARKTDKCIVLIACHYDVIEWLKPDWIIDCNKQEYLEHRRSVWQRSEKLEFTIKEVDKSTWKYFSKYHYLSESVSRGKSHFFGLFKDDEQVGFGAFTNYVPKRPTDKTFKMHSNRVVIHPDYIGFGLGNLLVEKTAEYLIDKYGYEIMAKFSSVPMYLSRIKNPKWKLIAVDRKMKKAIVYGRLNKGSRSKVKTFTFKYIGKSI